MLGFNEDGSDAIYCAFDETLDETPASRTPDRVKGRKSDTNPSRSSDLMETVRRLAPDRKASGPLVVPALLDMEPTSGGDEAPDDDVVDPVDDRLLARCRIICCWFIMISWAVLLAGPGLCTGMERGAGAAGAALAAGDAPPDVLFFLRLPAACSATGDASADAGFLGAVQSVSLRKWPRPHGQAHACRQGNQPHRHLLKYIIFSKFLHGNSLVEKSVDRWRWR